MAKGTAVERTRGTRATSLTGHSRNPRATIATTRVHKDQASQAARGLILLVPRPTFPAPSVTTLLYSTTVSRALRQPLRRSVSEWRSAEPSKIYLLSSLAMYACIPETRCGFFEGVCAPYKTTASFRDPPHHCANLDYGRYTLATKRCSGLCRIVQTDIWEHSCATSKDRR